MITTTFIYGLVDPRDGRVRYIGKADDPERRLTNHFSCQTPSHKRNWLLLLRRIGLPPRLIWLCRVPKTQWREMEKFQIAFFRSRGMADLNVTDGGDGVVGYRHTIEARLKKSESMRGRKLTEEQKLRLRKSNLGRKHTQETRKKLSESHRGKQNCLGYKHTVEARENMSIAHMGHRPSAETRSRLSQAHKGRVLTEETRKKIGAKLRGRRLSEEHKHKLCAAWKLRKGGSYIRLPLGLAEEG